ncbi:hypothetical protein MRX96_030288 [Rhipicephalus microplus]
MIERMRYESGGGRTAGRSLASSGVFRAERQADLLLSLDAQQISRVSRLCGETGIYTSARSRRGSAFFTSSCTAAVCKVYGEDRRAKSVRRGSRSTIRARKENRKPAGKWVLAKKAAAL